MTGPTDEKGQRDKIDEAMEFARHVAKWLRIRKMEGYPLPEDGSAFEVEADHSLRGGLLGWLVLGHEPFENPPPVSYSRPWYELVANGEATSMDVWVDGANGKKPVFQKPTVVIDQSPWLIVEDRCRTIRVEGQTELIIAQINKGTPVPEWGLWELSFVGRDERLPADSRHGEIWRLKRGPSP